MFSVCKYFHRKMNTSQKMYLETCFFISEMEKLILTLHLQELLPYSHLDDCVIFFMAFIKVYVVIMS